MTHDIDLELASAETLSWSLSGSTSINTDFHTCDQRTLLSKHEQGEDTRPNNEHSTLITHADHAKAIKDTKRNIHYWLLAGILSHLSFVFANSIWMFKAEKLASAEAATAMLGIQEFFIIITSFVYANVSDKYGFDKVATLLQFACIIGATLQCADNFYVFSTGTIIAYYPKNTIMLAVISRLLPVNEATKYMSYNFAISSLGSIGFTAFAGYIAEALSMDTVYYLGAAMALIPLIVMFDAVWNTQTELERTQREFTEFYVHHHDAYTKNERFPICVQHTDEEGQNATIGWIQFVTHYANLMMVIIAAAVSTGISHLFHVLYPLYVAEQMEDGNVFLGTVSSSINLTAALLAQVLTPYFSGWLDRKAESMQHGNGCCSSIWYVFLRPQNSVLWIIVVEMIGLISLANVTNIHTMWTVMPVCFFLLETTNMMLHVFIIKLQPTSMAGTVSVLTSTCLKLFVSVALPLAGVLYHAHAAWFWYFTACCVGTAGLCIVAIIRVNLN